MWCSLDFWKGPSIKTVIAEMYFIYLFPRVINPTFLPQQRSPRRGTIRIIKCITTLITHNTKSIRNITIENLENIQLIKILHGSL